MTSRLKVFFRKRLQLHEGEGRKLFPLLLLMFLTLTILLLLKPTSTGIFVAELGAAALSTGYIAVAIAAVLVTFLLTNFTQRVATTVLLRATFLFTAVLVALLIYFRQQLQLSTPGLYTLYIWGNLFGVVAVSQVYLLAGELFDIQTARRFFVWLGVAAIGGGVFGGYLTSVLAGLLDADAVLEGVFLLCLSCIGLCYLLPAPAPSSEQPTDQNSERFWQLILTPVRYFQQSRYLQLVATMVALGVIVAKLVEYQFSIIAVSHFTDKDSLTAFFGFWLSTISLISLIIQLLLTDRIIERVGITKSLQLLPRGLFLATFAILFSPVLWAVVFARVIDGGIKQSVHRSAFELSLLPLSSNEKKMSKTFIDIFVDSAATGISGLLLAVLLWFDHIPIRLVALVTIIFLVAWIFVLTRFSEAYVEVFRQRIGQDSPEDQPTPVKQPLIEMLEETVQRGRPKHIRRLLNKVRLAEPQAVFVPTLRHLLSHQHAGVRKLAIASLQAYRQVDVSDEVETILKYDASAEVKTQALYYLTMRYSRHDLLEVVELLDGQDQEMAHAALFTLLAETRSNARLWKKLGMQQRLEQLINETEETPPGVLRSARRQIAARAIVRARKVRYYPLLVEWIPTSSANTRRQLFSAIRHLRHPRFLPFLWQLLETRHRQEAIQALGTYSDTAFFRFLRKQEVQQQPTRLRILPRILRHLLPSPRALQQLYEWLGHPDPMLREETLMALRQYQSQHKEFKLSRSQLRDRLKAEAKEFWQVSQLVKAQEAGMSSSPKLRDAQFTLLGLLEKRQERVLRRIFRLLTLYYDEQDFGTIFKNFRSKEESKYPLSLSFLQTLLSNRVRKQVLPVVKYWLYRQEPLMGQTPSLTKCYRQIIETEDRRLQLSLVQVLRYDTDAAKPKLLRLLRKSSHPLVRQRADELTAEA